MVGILLYEMKRKMKNIIMVCVGMIIAFAAAFFVMKWMPQVVITIAQTINRSAALRSFLGIDKAIEAVTYKQLAMSVLTFICPVFCYLWVNWSADAFWHEEKYGTLHYFYAQPISRMAYWAAKTLVNVLAYAVCMIFLYLSMILLSLNGVPVKLLKEMTMEDVNHVMISVLCVGILCVGTGTLLGSAANRKRANRWLRYCFGMMLMLCFLPGLLRTLAVWLSSLKLDVGVVTAITGVLQKVRLLVPLYWCNPWHRMETALSGGQIGVLLITAVIIFTGAAVVYSRRSLIRE